MIKRAILALVLTAAGVAHAAGPGATVANTVGLWGQTAAGDPCLVSPSPSGSNDCSVTVSVFGGSISSTITGPLGTKTIAQSVAVTSSAGAIPDIGTGASPGANTLNGRMAAAVADLDAISSNIGAGTAAPGASPPATAVYFAGTDGSVLRGILTDISGRMLTGATCTGVIPINVTGTTDLKTFTNKGAICSIVLVNATAQSVSLSEGTGTNCGTGTAYLLGGSGGTMALATNGGFSSVGGAPWLKMQTAGDHLCLILSGATNVSGVITYVAAPSVGRPRGIVLRPWSLGRGKSRACVCERYGRGV
jgi:hypothetical protein